jgi:shikimate dehydrogenase
MTGSRRAGVIGWPLKHSISPEFQQPAFDRLGLDVTYGAYEIAPAALPGFVQGLRSPEWLGCNVTIPHKQDVFRLVDELSDEARLIGAVNTIVNTGGTLLGHNTDATGFLRALTGDAGFDPAGKAAVVLGARGSARAVAVALLRAGIGDLHIANRTVSEAERLVATLAASFPQRSGRYALAALPLEPEAVRAPLSGAALLVNCTSVGMAHGPAPDALPLPAGCLGDHLLVYDLVYNPARTPLLCAAAAAGAWTQEGLPMLIYQGAASFERWTGQPAPVDVMLRAGRAALEART